jgi:Fe2+ or Zn2+ uptake regulation protein
MSHHTWNYQRTLRAEGYRVTPQREAIMDIVCESGGRLSARELLERAEAYGVTMDAATVYRNLRFLTERKLLRAVEHEDRTCYELAGPHASHHHLVCHVCGAEVEIPETATDAFYRHILDEHGFAVEEDHLVLRGVCARCREAAATAVR